MWLIAPLPQRHCIAITTVHSCITWSEEREEERKGGEERESSVTKSLATAPHS